MQPKGVLALGNFDGVHRGHLSVIEAAIAKASTLGCAAQVLTFEPHPRAFFTPDLPPFRLTPAAAKERLLRAAGIKDVIVLPFNYELAQLAAQDFVEKILVERLDAQHIVAGHDFGFGRGRAGDMQKLEGWLKPHGVGISEIASLGDGTAFSSTRIRELLRAGDVKDAAEILGRNWAIAGVIEKGDQRGRTIGVPTANIGLGDYLRPRFGVYRVMANRVGDAKTYRGVANIGVRPTVDGNFEKLEAHLFDFDADIYGQEWEFALTSFIRPEAKFADLNDLKKQIERDIIAAKAL